MEARVEEGSMPCNGGCEEGKRLAERAAYLEGLLLGLADASGNVLGQDLAALAQARGVEVALSLSRVMVEVEDIRKARKG